MASTPTASPALTLIGKPVPGALDRQLRIPGFDQERLSRSRVVCIGAGGLIGNIAPTLVRKGVGALAIFDDDEVEASNLNRQHFYVSDIGQNKALALARNLQQECILPTRIEAFPMRLEEAVARGADLRCEVAVTGVDNNPTRVLASRTFRQLRIPAIFCAVSAEADHGYVFVQQTCGPCFGCLFPDSASHEQYPCPATPAIADILQIIGGITVYAVDSCLMGRPRSWRYRRLNVADGQWDASTHVERRQDCPVCGVAP